MNTAIRTFRPLLIIVCLTINGCTAMCILRNIICAIMISFNSLWRHQIDFQRYCPFVRGNHMSVDSPHKGTVTRTFDVFLSVWKNLLNKHSIGRHFETPWRSFDVAVMYWIVSMVVAGALTPIWCQDILNHRGEIGQLHIYRHAFFFIKIVPWYQLLCGSGNATQCKRHFLLFFVIA